MASSSASPPLARLTVVELGEWVAVPYAGKLLADLGADVVKVERAGVGDATRRWGPFPPGSEGDPERSGMFAQLNSSKRSVTVDAAPDAGPECAAELLRDADIILIDQWFLGSSYEDSVSLLRRRIPSAVVVTVTPFGTSGLRAQCRGYDLTASAAGGISFGVGERDRAPLPLPFAQCDHQAGISAAIGALMAVLARGDSGAGQHVDISVQDVMASLHSGYHLPRYIFGGGVVGLRNGRQGGNMPYPNTVLPCKDGVVSLIAPKIEQWRRFLALLGNPTWSTQSRYRDRRAMQWEYKDEVDALLAPWFLERTKAELLDLFVEHRIPFAPLMGGNDLAENAHLRWRTAVRQQELPGGGTFMTPTVPYRFGRSGWRSERAPRLGEHGSVGSSETEEPRPAGTADLDRPAPPPLSGLLVLDLGTAWAGGIAGRLLGDFGATVIKVESWSHMDGSRMGRPILVEDAAGGDSGKWPDLQPGFHVHGRSKRSLSLDLRSERGVELMRLLAAQADVVIHNFPPGVLDKLGLPPDQLIASNDRLVVVGQSVAGSSGPLAAYTGYASTVASLGGLGLAVGYEGEPPIGTFEGIYSDVLSALTTVYATMAALVERAGSGRGQLVDVSQWEATLALAAEVLVEHSLTGRARTSVGFAHPLLCPHGNYRAAGGDPDTGGDWLSIAVASDAEWKALLDCLGHTRIPAADAVGWNATDRHAHRQAIDEAVAAWVADVDAAHAEETLREAGIAAAKVGNIADVFVDEHLLDRGLFVDVDHPLVGSEPMPGLPWTLSRTPGVVKRRAPLLGEHSREVLMELLHLPADEYEALVAQGVVQTGPPNRAPT